MTSSRASHLLGIPWWAQVSAVTAPALLVSSWLLTGGVAVSKAPARLSLSDLTTQPGWWLMPAVVTGVGLAYLVSAAGLRPADVTGRGFLAAGGALTVLSGWMPVLGRSGVWHTNVTYLAFVTLGVWPALIASDRLDAPLVLRRRSGEVLAVGLGALLLLCVMSGMDPRADGSGYGLQQRLLMTAQALVPLVIVLGVELHLAATRRQVASQA